jgi:hypothetical protein
MGNFQKGSGGREEEQVFSFPPAAYPSLSIKSN